MPLYARRAKRRPLDVLCGGAGGTCAAASLRRSRKTACSTSGCGGSSVTESSPVVTLAVPAHLDPKSCGAAYCPQNPTGRRPACR